MNKCIKVVVNLKRNHCPGVTNSPVTLSTVPNKQLYNGGSEWQNDYTNLPDYYQTFNRNYDAALGRFVGVDPKAERVESMNSYQYAGNNPIMYNDPLGDLINADKLPPVGYGPSGPSSFSGEFAQLQLENSAYNFVYGGGGFNPDYIGRSSDPIGSGVYDRATGTGSLSGAVALINSVSGGKVGSVQSLISDILEYVIPGNYSGIMLNQVNIFDNPGWVHLNSPYVKVTFDPGADLLVNPRLETFFLQLTKQAHNVLGVNSINISSTTNHPSNRQRSAHTQGRAFDINYIDGIHVGKNDITDDFQAIIQFYTTGWMENYGPMSQTRWIDGQSIGEPGQEYGHTHPPHIHVSIFP